ncbi:MAG: hypothetical protein EOM85_03550 [Candidatus Moranbacteria bacterium]|nr:hypothetical protein [Candidatus Moranbacteria bacterium]
MKPRVFNLIITDTPIEDIDDELDLLEDDDEIPDSYVFSGVSNDIKKELLSYIDKRFNTDISNRMFITPNGTVLYEIKLEDIKKIRSALILKVQSRLKSFVDSNSTHLFLLQSTPEYSVDFIDVQFEIEGLNYLLTKDSEVYLYGELFDTFPLSPCEANAIECALNNGNRCFIFQTFDYNSLED